MTNSSSFSARLDDDIDTPCPTEDARKPDSLVDMDDVVDRAKELEASFATDHPTAVRVLREVVDLLVRMGI